MTAFRWGSSGGGVPVSPYLSPTAYNPALLNRTAIPAFHIFPGSPLTLFFEERTGASATTPTAQGGLVGTIFDTLTGRYAVAPSDAARATLSKTGVRQKLVFGGDDAYSVAIDMSGADELAIVAGIYKPIAVSNAFVEFTASSTTNPNSFLIQAPGATSKYFFRSKGSSEALISITDEAHAAPQYAVITATSKIATPIATFRINGAQVGTSAVSQGTGNFANSTLYIGARAGISSFFTGEIYGLVVRNKSFASTNERDDVEEFIRTNTPNVFF